MLQFHRANGEKPVPTVSRHEARATSPTIASTQIKMPIAASFSGPGICAAPRWSMDETQKVNAVTKGAH